MQRITIPPAAYWGAWALAGAYNFCRDIFDAPWQFLLPFNIAHFTTWALLGVLVMPIMRRYPLRAHWKPWLFHLVLGAIVTQIDITIGHLIVQQTLGYARKLNLLELSILAFKSCFHLGLLTYWCFLGTVQGIDGFKLVRTRERQIAEQKTAFVNAQLQSLRTQLQPHFLFNTLHAIASFMHYDVPTADRMLNRLSELLRISLQETGSPVIALKREMDFIRAYLDIEKIRFEDRLKVQWQVSDALHEFPVPPFILQPLVENAIKFAVAPRAAGGNIVIRAYLEGPFLLLEVEDDAVAAQPQMKGFGIGLSNTRKRLDTLYGHGQRLELRRQDERTVARIRIPVENELALAA